MALGSIIGGTLRALLISAGTAAAAFGLLFVFQPFGRTAPTSTTTVTMTESPAAGVLANRIETVRLALRESEGQLEFAQATNAAPTAASPDSPLAAQYQAQIAAATERRDLARRHAEAIRTSLDAGVTPSSQAAIRDSVVVGQLLSQQATLDAQIAEERARLRSNHPTMRALNAQRAALTTQIRQEAANIAAALEAEARIDDAQIELLTSQLPDRAAATAPPDTQVDTSALAKQVATQRAELDSLIDAYFDIPPAVTSTTPQARPADPLNALNLLVVAIAGLAALVFQIFLAARRRPRPETVIVDERDVTAWQEDHDPEVVGVVVAEPEPLRKAS